MTSEATELTLNEEGLKAVSKFLKKATEEENPKPKVPGLEERQLDLWEPPIDNECD
jgi:hypothetical protein